MSTIFNRFHIVVLSTLMVGSFSFQNAAGQCPSGWAGPLANQCTNNAPFQLTTGTPSSGTYIGTGVTGSGPYFFNPQISGNGTFQIGHIAPGCTDTAFTSITVNTIPNVGLTANGPFCENQDSVSLTGGSPSAGGTGYYYGTAVSSSSGKFGPTIGAGPQTVGYTFTATATGCSDSAEITVTVNTITAASATGLDTAYYINATPASIPVVTAPSGGVLSGPGVTGSNFNIASAGIGNHVVQYVFTNSNGCTDTSKLNVHVRALPVVTFVLPPGQKFSCELDLPFTISGATPSPGYPQNWFTGANVDTILGTFDPDSNHLGWNVITAHYFDGVCVNTRKDSVLVNENPNVSLSAFPTPCANDVDFILNQGSPTSGGTGVYSGPGVTGIGPYFFNPVAAGAGTHPITYCFTAANGCETCVTQNITVNPTPTAFFSSLGFQICENDAPIDLSPFGTPAGGYFTGPGISSDSVTLRPATLIGAGSYTWVYNYKDANGCMDSASQNFTVHPKPRMVLTSVPATTPNPPTDSSNITVKICVFDTAMITYAATPTSDFAIFPSLDIEYVPGGFNPRPQIDREYAVVAQAKTTQCKDTGHVLIKVIPVAKADILGDSTICLNDSTVLTASGANSYKWLKPTTSTTTSITVKPKFDTEYQVIAISDKDGDGKQCSEDTTITTVEVSPLPLITTGLDTSIFIGDYGTLMAYGGESYVWSGKVQSEIICDSCQTTSVFPDISLLSDYERYYFVVGTDSNGCVNKDSVKVILDPKIIVFVPTAFSPNGDGYNDFLEVKTKGIRKYDLEIYDRFGKSVYSTSGTEAKWDGTLDGTLLTKDVFLYKLSAYPYKSALPIEQAGQITLIR